MDEIRKVRRVIQKADAGAPHETLLVLDANTGQNALAQVKAFDEALALTGLVLTKLDGTAKGGVVAAIAKQHPVPLRFIGVGEQRRRPAAVRRRGVRRRAARLNPRAPSPFAPPLPAWLPRSASSPSSSAIPACRRARLRRSTARASTSSRASSST